MYHGLWFWVTISSSLASSFACPALWSVSVSSSILASSLLGKKVDINKCSKIYDLLVGSSFILPLCGFWVNLGCWNFNIAEIRSRAVVLSDIVVQLGLFLCKSSAVVGVSVILHPGFLPRFLDAAFGPLPASLQHSLRIRLGPDPSCSAHQLGQSQTGLRTG